MAIRFDSGELFGSDRRCTFQARVGLYRIFDSALRRRWRVRHGVGFDHALDRNEFTVHSSGIDLYPGHGRPEALLRWNTPTEDRDPRSSSVAEDTV